MPGCFDAEAAGRNVLGITAGKTLLCEDIRVDCSSVQQCLLLWAAAHAVLCVNERGGRAAVLHFVQMTCLKIREHAPRGIAGKIQRTCEFLGISRE